MKICTIFYKPLLWEVHLTIISDLQTRNKDCWLAQVTGKAGVELKAIILTTPPFECFTELGFI